MNKRQIKKIKGIKTVELLKAVSSKDCLIFQYDMNKTYPEQLHKVHNYLKKNIENEIVFIPKDIGLISNNHKENIIEYLENYINKLRTD